MIKLFLILNKGTHFFLQKVGEFSGPFFFFYNLDSWAFLPTWECLFPEMLLPGKSRETEV